MAGYGDPIDGHPSVGERQLHLWTNAVRVAPEAFDEHYAAGGCTSAEFTTAQLAPKAPLRWVLELNRVARAHSADMEANGFVGHRSSDGTEWDDRVGAVYPFPEIGENVASTGGGPHRAVFTVWMCSSGHRGNILSDSYDELGTGISGAYFTQDFGHRGVSTRQLAMGAHWPSDPGDEVTLRVDHHDDGPPDHVWAVVNGDRVAMDLEHGTARNGVFATTQPLDPLGACHTYWFESRRDGVATAFPEQGSYGFGDCDWDDAGALWIDDQPLNPVDDDPQGCGCDTGGAGWGFVLPLLLSLRRRWRCR